MRALRNYLRVYRRRWLLTQEELAFLFGYDAESIISRFGRSMGSDQTISPNGQTPVFMVTLLAQDGKFQMGLMKPIFKGMGPLGKMNEISGLGDEAFSASDSLLLVRKGDAAIMFTYNYLTDGTPKAEALARQILTQL